MEFVGGIICIRRWTSSVRRFFYLAELPTFAAAIASDAPTAALAVPTQLEQRQPTQRMAVTLVQRARLLMSVGWARQHRHRVARALYPYVPFSAN